MAIDPRIMDAINEAVAEKGQPNELAQRLVAWFESVATSNNNPEATDRYVEMLYKATELKNKAKEGDV